MTVAHSFKRTAKMDQSFNKQQFKNWKADNMPKRSSPLPIKNVKNRNRRAKTPTSTPQTNSSITILPRGASAPNLPIYSNPPVVEGSQNLTVLIGQMRTPNKGNSGHRQNKTRRHSPSKSISSGYSSSSDESRSPKDNYAGARFHLPPEPTDLPKPPTHWVTPTNFPTGFYVGNAVNACCASEMSSHLKTLLKVQVSA